MFGARILMAADCHIGGLRLMVALYTSLNITIILSGKLAQCFRHGFSPS